MDNKKHLFLGTIRTQLQVCTTTYKLAAQWYDQLSNCLVIPSILFTSCGSVMSMVCTSPGVDKEKETNLILYICLLATMSTFLQSCMTVLQFGTRAEMFRSASKQYDQLLVKIQFEQFDPNDQLFIETLETRIMEIQSTCKYDPPRSIIDRVQLIHTIPVGLTTKPTVDTSDSDPK